MLDAVIKCGGSLTRGNGVPALGRQLAQLGCQYRLLVVPGGGPFADVVRTADRRYGLSDAAAHWMAVLAMDQYGYLLSGLIPDSRLTKDLQDARRIARAKRIPVLLPFDLLSRTDPLPHRWSVTADSISAWITALIGAPRLILLKDVDGLYADGHHSEGDHELLEAISVEQLASCRGVDRFLATLLKRNRLDLWVINGNRPHRLKQLLATGETVGTRLQR